MFVKDNPQSDFSEIPFSELIYDPDHPLLKLAQNIDWNSLLSQLQRFYSPDRGCPSAPLRAQAANLMLKYLKNLPDREAVTLVYENIYAQRFCNLTPAQLKDYINPATGLSYFRAKIGPEGMALIQQTLHQAAQGHSHKKSRNLIVDTTCIPSDILYPTDIRLLERYRLNILRLLKKGKAWGLPTFYRTYSRTARKIFVRFSKLGKPKKKTRQKVHKQLFQFVRRNLKQLIDLRQKASRELGPLCPSQPRTQKFLISLKEVERKVQIILHQQRQVISGLTSVPHRIVSFHKDHIRPIVRGKFPLGTEFGPKALVAVFRGCVYLIDAFHNNVADATLLTKSLRWFKSTFGKLPKKLSGDRGCFSRWRVRFIRSIGVESGIQPRGHHIQLSPADARNIRQRLVIEAMISLGKRKFGWNRCRARNTSHERSWIGLQAASLSAHRTFLMEHPP
jgi:transposase, IS5 family